MIFALLQMIQRQFGQLTTTEPTPQAKYSCLGLIEREVPVWFLGEVSFLQLLIVFSS